VAVKRKAWQASRQKQKMRRNLFSEKNKKELALNPALIYYLASHPLMGERNTAKK
jgi:hypothetical protein